MVLEIEKYFIELISKINDLGTTLTNSPGARNQLIAIKNDTEILWKRTTAEYRRLADRYWPIADFALRPRLVRCAQQSRRWSSNSVVISAFIPQKRSRLLSTIPCNG